MKKRTVLALLVMLALLIPGVAFAAGMDGLVEGMPPKDGPKGNLVRYIDDVGLLSGSEAEILTERLNDVSNSYGFDTIVVVIQNLNGWGAREYAAEVYEAWDFGLDSQKSGVVLLLAMADRDYGFATKGRGIEILSLPIQDKIIDDILYYLKDDRWYDGFMAYANGVEKYLLKSAMDGPQDGAAEPVSVGQYMRMWSEEIGQAISTGIVFALIVAFIVLAVLRGQLKSVRPKDFAREYMRPGSLVLKGKLDRFLYRHVTKTAKPKDSSSSSSHGGGGFSSSSGGSWSGSSGKF